MKKVPVADPDDGTDTERIHADLNRASMKQEGRTMMEVQAGATDPEEGPERHHDGPGTQRTFADLDRPMNVSDVAASVFGRRRRLSRELAAQYLEADLSIDRNLVMMDPVVAPFVNAEHGRVASLESTSENDSAASKNSQEDNSNKGSMSSDQDDCSKDTVECERTESTVQLNEDNNQECSEHDSSSHDEEEGECFSNQAASETNEEINHICSEHCSEHDSASHVIHEIEDEIEEDGERFSNQAAPDSKYTTYHVAVNPDQDDRAADIPLYDCARPHMRAFHLAWLSFFVAFFTWFAMTPLLGEIARSLELSREEIWTSSVLAVSSSAFTRVLMGPLNDRYGARWVMAGTLVAAAIPTGLAGLINSASALYIVRLLIGIAGSAFVTCQYWTSCMFMVEIAGTANALTAGWGNMGGGFAQVLMGSILFPLFKVIFGGEGYSRFRVQDEDDDQENNDDDFDRPSDLAWRVILVFPALLSLVMAWVVIRYADDTPKGNMSRRLVEPASAASSLRSGVFNWNTWLLGFQYGCCFGVEITMIQAAALYFHEEFGQSTEAAAAIASIFGWMNLFARGIGGFSSDMANAGLGLRGRLICQVIFLCLQGSLVVVFSYTQTLGGAIFVMMIFSIFVQASEGSTYGIVPYVNPEFTGSISGLVAAGGNLGGVAFSLLFRSLRDRDAFLWMGCTVVGSAALTAFIHVPGHRKLLSGKDSYLTEFRAAADLPRIISFASPQVDESIHDPAETGSTQEHL
jgi:NNP family nitrate/nitrite transporter-like MFS transporter